MQRFAQQSSEKKAAVKARTKTVTSASEDKKRDGAGTAVCAEQQEMERTNT